MLNTMAGTCGYTEIQSFLKSMNLALDTIRYNVSGPSLDTMDTNLASERDSGWGDAVVDAAVGAGAGRRR